MSRDQASGANAPQEPADGTPDSAPAPAPGAFAPPESEPELVDGELVPEVEDDELEPDLRPAGPAASSPPEAPAAPAVQRPPTRPQQPHDSAHAHHPHLQPARLPHDATNEGRCPDHPRIRRGSTRHWRQRRAAALNAADGSCGCGAPATDAHHVVPLAEGGDPDGPLLALCETCHAQQHRARPSR